MAILDTFKNLETPIAIIGLGKSGKAAVALLKAVGFSDSEICTFDENDLGAQVRSPSDLILKNPRTLVISPGVSLATPWIQDLAQSLNVTITSEISLATRLLTTEKIIGITGSVGKSTVTSILGTGAATEDSSSFIGGNIGIPFSSYALDLLQGKQKAKWVVLELSSYQLENCTGLHLDYSAITFLSPNHLERYFSLEDYYQMKIRITSITKNICFFNQTSTDAVSYSHFSKCSFQLINAFSYLSESDRNKITLIGQHNYDNFSLAKAIADTVGWSPASIENMYHFQGLPHRLENLGSVNGVTYINDSKATAMDSVLVAVQGCLEKRDPQKTLFLLLGGKDKNLPWQELEILRNQGKIHFIFFGDCGQLAQEKSKLPGPTFKTLNEGIDYCFKKEISGDLVLLSPGGTSLDEFKNFEHRGHFFTNKVLRKSST